MPEIDGVQIMDRSEKYRLLYEAEKRRGDDLQAQLQQAQQRIKRGLRLAEVLEKSVPGTALLIKGALQR